MGSPAEGGGRKEQAKVGRGGETRPPGDWNWIPNFLDFRSTLQVGTFIFFFKPLWHSDRWFRNVLSFNSFHGPGWQVLLLFPFYK